MSAHVTGLSNFRRRINLFLLPALFSFLSAPVEVWAEKYEAQITGAYSWASTAFRSSLSSAYGIESPEYTFTDYGGKFFWRRSHIEPGFSSGIYTSIGVRGSVQATGSVPTATVATTGILSSGDYRFGLAWVPLQARARVWLWNDILFTEAGTGPAYGFGAIEYRAQFAAQSDNRYHKLSEWGWLTSATLGANFHIHSGLHLQLSVEGAWLFAKIRNPNLSAGADATLSQYFIRPGLAIALRF